MPYNEFTLDDVKRKLGLTVREVEGAFADAPPTAPSAWLVETLQEGTTLALSYATEKARSEWIIAPVLLEVRRQRRGELTVFSGAEFDVDAARAHGLLRLDRDPLARALRHRGAGDVSAYYLRELDRVLGVLLSMTAQEAPVVEARPTT